MAQVPVSEQVETAQVVDFLVDSVDASPEKDGAGAGDPAMKKVEESPEKEEGELKEKEADAVMPSPAVEKSSSFKEESNFLTDLKENEKKALSELRAKVEEAILENKLFKQQEVMMVEKQDEAKPAEEIKEEKERSNEEGEKEKPGSDEEKAKADTEKEESREEKEEKVEVNQDICLWGVPLLPSKGSEGTDVILLKFLRAREFKVHEAFEMLRNTLTWRKEFNMDSILDENTGLDLKSAAYMDGVDREGHPVCYNIYGVFEGDELYQKTFGTEEKRRQFLRWRLQVMEKGIQRLNFKPRGVSSMLQINDLKNSPGPSKKELRLATKQAVALLQDNYPEFVARNIFINVPFWIYALNALLSPFLTQRTKSKFVFARPAKVSETLLKYISAEDIPITYGGFKRENDSEFSVEDGGVSELIIKSGSTETLEIPAPEAGSTLLWDLTVLGWEVTYKEEFIPTDERSYTVIVSKSRKMSLQEEPIRNSFSNNEPGKVVLTIENNTFKKKRVLYRYKVKNSCH